MIICGFPGTGKSFVAKFYNWVDLESTPFEKDWVRYAKVAKHMSDNGYTVMVSTHKELLKEFEQIEVPYTVILPHPSDKEEFLNRYRVRGNSEEFIENINLHWEEWIDSILYTKSVLKTVVFLPLDGCIAGWGRNLGII